MQIYKARKRKQSQGAAPLRSATDRTPAQLFTKHVQCR